MCGQAVGDNVGNRDVIHISSMACPYIPLFLFFIQNNHLRAHIHDVVQLREF